MDLRVYYSKIREAAELIPGEFAVLISRETPDGGKEGVRSEAPKALAAKMLVEGRARLATQDETTEYHRQTREMKAKADREAALPKLQVAVLSEKDLEAFKTGRSDKSADEK